MKWIFKLVEWFLRETWWRRYYKRITLDEKIPWNGRCMVCDAGIYAKDIPRCNIKEGRYCPCKYNQCLKYNMKM